MKYSYLYLSCIFFLSSLSIQAQGPISWFADPITVGFQYIDNEGDTEEASSWQPGAMRFWVNDFYDSGSELGLVN